MIVFKFGYLSKCKWFICRFCDNAFFQHYDIYHFPRLHYSSGTIFGSSRNVEYESSQRSEIYRVTFFGQNVNQSECEINVWILDGAGEDSYCYLCKRSEDPNGRLLLLLVTPTVQPVTFPFTHVSTPYSIADERSILCRIRTVMCQYFTSMCVLFSLEILGGVILNIWRKSS